MQIRNVKKITSFPKRSEYKSSLEYSSSVEDWLRQQKEFSESLSFSIEDTNIIYKDIESKANEVALNTQTVEDAKDETVSAKNETVSAKDTVVTKADEVALNTQTVEDAKDVVLEAQTNVVANAQAISNNLIEDTQATKTTLYSSFKIEELVSALTTNVTDLTLENIAETTTKKHFSLTAKQKLSALPTKEQLDTNFQNISNVINNLGSTYLGKTATAKDSEKLGGVLAEEYLRKGDEGIMASNNFFEEGYTQLSVTPNNVELFPGENFGHMNRCGIVDKGDYIYILGGTGNLEDRYNYSAGTSSSSFVKVDKKTNKKEVLQNFPKPIFDPNIQVVGNKIYVFTVLYQERKTYQGTLYTRTEKEAYCFNINTEVWTKLSNTPFGVEPLITVNIEDNIYLFGVEASTTLYKYNTLTDSYEQRVGVANKLSLGYSCKKAFVKNGFIYFIPKSGKKLRKYNYASNLWEDDTTNFPVSFNSSSKFIGAKDNIAYFFSSNKSCSQVDLNTYKITLTIPLKMDLKDIAHYMAEGTTLIPSYYFLIDKYIYLAKLTYTSTNTNTIPYSGFGKFNLDAKKYLHIKNKEDN